ncbi:hypothetical protein [Pandoraea sp.]|uniref:hypothetical protein n=1 Tax=Pandoraea sp. TaxID=1883445 RepID=UPI0035B0EDE8
MSIEPFSIAVRIGIIDARRADGHLPACPKVGRSALKVAAIASVMAAVMAGLWLDYGWIMAAVIAAFRRRAPASRRAR